MVLCFICERLKFPIVTRGQSSEAVRLCSSFQSLQRSAKNCDLCHLFEHALSDIRMKGIKNNSISLHTWGSDVEGDPVGMSRVFVKVGETVGRFVDVFAEENSPGTEAGIAAGRNLEENYEVGSSAAFSLYRYWLNDCITKHKKCLDNSSVELPSRVLEVSSQDGSPTLRLLQSKGLIGQYTALSHCWCAHSGLITCKSSLQDHLTSINPSSLSKTVHDAVSITRGLGSRYIWVDTLCIIQDDKEDWKRESSKMDQVYRYALVMIAASSAKSKHEGCFFKRDFAPEPVIVPLHVTTSKELTSITFKIHSGSAELNAKDLVLNQRAWCLQESVLPHRILHFRKDRVIWQCSECLTAEDYIYLQRNEETSNGFDKSKRFPQLSVTPDYKEWLNIVEDYSRRELTVYTDKLYAIEGLANYFKSSLQTSYFAGMWFKGVHLCLVWISADGEMQDPPSPRAPTWSWAALDGSIYHLQSLRTLEVSYQVMLDVLSFGDKEISSEGSKSNEIQYERTTLIVSARQHRIHRSDSIITASEFNTVASKSLHNLLYERRDMQCHSLCNSAGNVCGWASFDQGSFVEEDTHCLLVSTFRDDASFQAHEVLILGYAHESRNSRRIGVGEIVLEDFFDNAQKQTIALV